MKKPEMGIGCETSHHGHGCPLLSGPSHHNASVQSSGKESDEAAGDAAGVKASATDGVSTRLKMLVQKRKKAEDNEKRTISSVNAPDESVKNDKMPVKRCRC